MLKRLLFHKTSLKLDMKKSVVIFFSYPVCKKKKYPAYQTEKAVIIFIITKHIALPVKVINS